MHGIFNMLLSVLLCLTSLRTLRMIFEDLQTACSDLAGYCQLPPRPPYGRYTRLLELGDYKAGRTFWLTHHTSFNNLKLKFPVLGPADTTSASTKRIKKLLHLPRFEDTDFSLQTIGRTYLLPCLLPILC